MNIVQVSVISAGKQGGLTLLESFTNHLSAIMKWGFGHHAAYLNKEEKYNSLLYFYVFQCFVKNTVGLTKVSFLFLYLDIFPQRKFRILCWALLIHIAIGLITLSFTTIFQCYPIAFNYDKTIKGGKWLVEIVTFVSVAEALTSAFKYQPQSILVWSIRMEHPHGCYSPSHTYSCNH